MLGLSLVVANGLISPDSLFPEEGRVQEEDIKLAKVKRCNIKVDYNPVTQGQYRPCQPLSPAQTLVSNNCEYPVIHRVDLAMTLIDNETGEAIHTYTSIQCETASAPKPIDDMEDWHTFFPSLADEFDQGSMDCPMYLFDVSFSLMENYPGSSILGIENSLDITQGACYTNWRSYTRFYTNQGHLVDLVAFFKGTEFEEYPWRKLDSFQVPGTSEWRLKELPLKSLWWAKTFSNMLRQNIRARATGDPRAMAIEEENIERYLQGISVMQEIYATPLVHGAKRRRLATLLWRFRKARKGEAATTSWRQLMPPASLVKSESPRSTRPWSPLSSKKSTQKGSIRQSGDPYADYYNPQQQQPSIFTDNAEDMMDLSVSEGSSRASTPPLDESSFPSSTSSSFPSHISDSSYPPQVIHESSFQSKDLGYPTLVSYEAQDSQYSSQEVLSPSQEVYESQDSIYNSQESFCHHDPNEIYEWPTPPTLLPDDVNATQDFTGGKIHISYPLQPDGSFPGFEPYLIEPQANMTAQHQQIQQMELLKHQECLGADLRSQVEQEQCVDWQLIAEQHIQVVDLGFHGAEVEEVGVLRQYEDYADGGNRQVQTQGQILGEVIDEAAMNGELEGYH